MVLAFRTLREAVHYRDFWLLAGTYFVCGASTNGLIGTHLIPACMDHGYSEVTGAAHDPDNAGVDGAVIAQKVKESSEANFGYNALTHEYGDLMKMGVIVPTKVERSALQNAASIASLLLTTDAVVSEIKEDKPEPAGAPGGT